MKGILRLRKWLKSRNMKIYLFSFIFFLILGKSFGQDPNWSVNPNDYQYNMSFTAFLNVNGNTLSASNDKVAAFINDEVRGVANVVFVPNSNKYVVYLSVFANTNGETISFKIYDSTNDNVVNVITSEIFKIDGDIGTVFQSFSIANPTLNNQADLSSFEFVGITEKSVSITGNKVDILVPQNTNISNLVANFMLSNGANLFLNRVKQTSGSSVQDYSNPIIFEVLSQNESVLKEYEVQVEIEKVVLPSDLTVNLSSTSSSLVKHHPVEIQVQTSEPITELARDDFLTVNGVIHSIISINSTTYIVQCYAIEQGLFSIEIPKNKLISDTNNKNNVASNKLSFSYDNVAPYLSQIQRKTPNQEITNNDSVTFTVIFSEAVENVMATDFESVTNAIISLQKITDTSYNISVKNINNYNGTVSVSLKNTNSIRDKAGNLLRKSFLKNYTN